METLKLQKWQRIFVNRSLNMGSIKSIGFDMDHTLAPYHRENFEALAFKKTVEKFVAAGYPEELSELNFDPNFVIRGLLVDRERGNLLKVDGHKYVKMAYHGHTPLTKEERHAIYNAQSFRAHDFLSIDTFFALSEVQLFIEIVNYMAQYPGKILKSFKEVYADLRKFIDLSHNDGSIKEEVLKNPERYIIKDRHMTETLLRLITAGKKLFLLTNSQWEYTDFVMKFLLDGTDENYPSWRHFFEYIFVGTNKPSFFTGSQPFLEVMTESGLLRNPVRQFEKHHIYFGGNAMLFQSMTEQKGDEILYLGDHIYTDIIRSKELFNWRTLLIVEELDLELPKIEDNASLADKINQQLHVLEIEDEKAQILRSRIDNDKMQLEKNGNGGDRKKRVSHEKNIAELSLRLTAKEEEIAQLHNSIKSMIQEREKNFHPLWGELMRVGWEKSRFAKQIEEYACLYTGRVTNLRFYSPFKRFTSPRDLMPHDL